MTARRQVLFVQGGGAGTYDEWDGRLVASLRSELGDGWEVRYPRMPAEDDPDYPTWSAAIRSELLLLEDGAIAVGHSVGGTILAGTISDERRGRQRGGAAGGDRVDRGLGGAAGGDRVDRGLGGTAGDGRAGRGPGGAAGDEGAGWRLGGIVLIAAPFVEGPDLPPDVPVHVFHGSRDETIPPGHAEMYGTAIPHARVTLLPDRDHQLGDDLSEVARVISGW